MKYSHLKKIRNYFYRSISPKKFMSPIFKSNDFGFRRGTPIDRYYIENFLNFSKDYINGNVLEFGDSFYYNKLSICNNSSCDIFTSEMDNRNDGIIRIHGDLSDVHYSLFSKYDCIICTNVLNFIFDINAAILGIYNILKPGAVCIVTLAGYSTHISRYDYEKWGDYWRFSDKGAIKLFEKYFEIIFIKNYGNFYSATAQMSGFSIEELEIEKINSNEKDYTMLTGLVLKKRFINE